MNIELCPIDNGFFCTFLWSITPLLELRASIPLGYLDFGLTIYESVGVSVLGGVFSATITILLLPFFVSFAEKHSPFFKKILKKITDKTQSKHEKKMKIWGDIFLVLFVAIPLPGSGAFSGALAAYIFGVKKKLAIMLISVGILISGILVAILTLFGHEIWQAITN